MKFSMPEQECTTMVITLCAILLGLEATRKFDEQYFRLMLRAYYQVQMPWNIFFFSFSSAYTVQHVNLVGT